MQSAIRKSKNNASPKKPIHFGPIDVLAVSPPGGNRNECWHIRLHPAQVNSKAAKEFLFCIKKLKPSGELTGWAFTYVEENKAWYNVSNDGVPNNLPLGECFEDPNVKALLRDSDIIKSVTFKERKDGPNISYDAAVTNSAEWFETEEEESADAVPDVLNLPGSNIFDNLKDKEESEEVEVADAKQAAIQATAVELGIPLPPPVSDSEPGSSATHAATPPADGRRGRGRRA